MLLLLFLPCNSAAFSTELWGSFMPSQFDGLDLPGFDGSGTVCVFEIREYLRPFAVNGERGKKLQSDVDCVTAQCNTIRAKILKIADCGDCVVLTDCPKGGNGV
jgi:hypothetical protein